MDEEKTIFQILIMIIRTQCYKLQSTHHNN